MSSYQNAKGVKNPWQLAKELWPNTSLYDTFYAIRSPSMGELSGKPLTPEEQAQWDETMRRYKEEDERNRVAWSHLLILDARRAKNWNGYPMHIELDRYGGCYSHGKYVAWPVDPGMAPDDAMGGDNECASFWEWAHETPGVCIGLGPSPSEAWEDLKNKVVRAAEEKTSPAP